MKKIDIHCHTTHIPFQGRVATIEDIQSNMRQHDIEVTNILATYFPHKQSGKSNFHILHYISDKDDMTMFGSLDFESEYYKRDFYQLQELAEKGLMKGIKIYTGYQWIFFDDKPFRRVMDLAKKHDLPMMFHCGITYGYMRKYKRPARSEVTVAIDLEFIAQEGITTIVSHLAKPYIQDTIDAVNRNDNMYTDMGGVFTSGVTDEKIPKATEFIRKFLEHSGPDRLLFATDYPMQTHVHSIEILDKALEGFSQSDKKKVYYDNARAILRI